MKKVLWLAVGLSLLVCACNRQQASPQQVVLEFVDLWNQGAYSEMYQLLSPQVRAQVDEETFVSRYQNISQGIGLESVAIVEKQEAANDATARLDYVLQFKTSTVGEFSLSYDIGLEKVEQEWLLVWDHCHIFPGLTADTVVRVTREVPSRGSILDRNGSKLAYDGQARTVGLVPGRIDDEEQTVTGLAELVDMRPEQIRQLLRQPWVKPDLFVPIKQISEGQWQEQRQQLLALPGVMVNSVKARVYQIPEGLAQTVGYVSEISESRLQQLAAQGWRAGDKVGTAGLELLYDQKLRGQPGFAITIRQPGGEIVAYVAHRPAVAGSDVVTTLDASLQQKITAAMAEKRGAALILNHATGEILAVVSQPGYDSNHFALGISTQQYNRLQKLDQPFVNRAFEGLYPPGSVFKPFTALMALAEGVFAPEESWDTPQQWQPDPSWGGYHVTRVSRPAGAVNLDEAMKWSDNVYFADLGLRLGWENFTDQGERLGFGRSIPFALTSTISRLTNTGRGDILLADTSYGQGEMVASPLHITLMYAALARGDGIIPVPSLEWGQEGQQWLDTGYPPDLIERVDQSLLYAASDSGARGWAGAEAVRGKTGTSEISATRQVAWYVCYFDDLVITIVLEGDRSLGSHQAAAVARAIINAIR